MSNSGKQSPLGVNTLGSLLQNTGFRINSVAASYMGSSTSVSNYTFGTLCSSTCLNVLTTSIRRAFTDGSLNTTTYNNLISIGSGSIPALGNSKAPTYTWTGAPTWNPYLTTEITSYGYARLFALQAYNEFNYNGSLPVYKDFLMSFMAASGFIDQSNSAILTVFNSIDFVAGTYSNMNDLISADITGVSLSTTVFGQDLVTSGKAIDLSTISTFGLPSNLLSTLNTYNAITPSLSLALLSSGMSVSEISDILGKVSIPSTLQQRNIYGAFMIIVGQDLTDILIPLNCKTQGLESLAELLNPQKLFPNSYPSLTVPVYNASAGPTNSKTYYPIYEDGGVSSRITSQSFGEYLQDILPADVAIAAGAFGATMRQIRNVSAIPIEKFAQVVSNIETTQDLSVNGTSVPVDAALANNALSLIALGSGPHGTYTMSNFLGCMSGLPYDWKTIQSLIIALQTPALSSIYSAIYARLISGIVLNIDSDIQTLIDSANAEIAAIKAAQTTKSTQLNTLWNITGTQLTIEQRARVNGLPELPSPRVTTMSTFPTIQYSFVDQIVRYAKNTVPHMYAQTLEAISDLTGIGGQSIVGMMREARNTATLMAAGITLDNNIPDSLSVTDQTSLIANGTIQAAVSGTGIPGTGMPVSGILDGLELTIPAILAQTDSTGSLLVPAQYGVYDPTTNSYTLTNPLFGGIGQPVDTGSVSEPGSFAGSLYQGLLPPELNVIYTSGVLLPATPTIQSAIDEVVACNCDCWQAV
jgi:hypothetical protein